VTQPRDYVIEGGGPGRERLRLLSAVLAPTTKRLLDRVGLGAGMRCIDFGCGGGNVTAEMARRVGPSGRAVGIDFDEQVLAIASADVQQAGLTNVTFRRADVGTLGEPPDFDVVYARFLLTHLRDWRGGLGRMVAAAHPGGAVVVEDIDFNGHFWHPDCEAFRRYVVLYQETVTRHGGDPNIGPKLPRALAEAGLGDVQVEVVQPAFLTGEGKSLAAVTMRRIASRVVEANLAGAEEVAGIVAELEEFAADPRTLLSLPRVFQVWGRRPRHDHGSSGIQSLMSERECGDVGGDRACSL
jgi:SAM-dependent methyltransferase